MKSAGFDLLMRAVNMVNYLDLRTECAEVEVHRKGRISNLIMQDFKLIYSSQSLL